VGEVSNISGDTEEFPSDSSWGDTEEFPSDNSWGDLTVGRDSPDAGGTVASIHSSTAWQLGSLSVWIVNLHKGEREIMLIKLITNDRILILIESVISL